MTKIWVHERKEQELLGLSGRRAVEGQLGVWREWNSVVSMFLGLFVLCAMCITLYLTITRMRYSREAKRKEMEMKLIVGKAEPGYRAAGERGESRFGLSGVGIGSIR